MAIRDTIRANAASLLAPGEEIQAVATAQTTTPYLVLLSAWILIITNAYRVIVVTDRRILICRSGRFRMTPVREILAELPRNTRIGPAHGLWYRCSPVGMLYISRRFHKDIAAADDLIGASAPAPTDAANDGA